MWRNVVNWIERKLNELAFEKASNLTEISNLKKETEKVLNKPKTQNPITKTSKFTITKLRSKEEARYTFLFILNFKNSEKSQLRMEFLCQKMDLIQERLNYGDFTNLRIYWTKF